MAYTVEQIKGLVEKVLENTSDSFVRNVYMDCLLAYAEFKNEPVLDRITDFRKEFIETGIFAGFFFWDVRKHLSSTCSF